MSDDPIACQNSAAIVRGFPITDPKYLFFADSDSLFVATFVVQRDRHADHSSTLKFEFLNHPDYFGLDDVNVVEVAASSTPEPASGTLVGASLIALAGCADVYGGYLRPVDRDAD